MIESKQEPPLDRKIREEVEEILARLNFGEANKQPGRISRLVDYFYDKLFYGFIAVSTAGGVILGFTGGMQLSANLNNSWAESGMRAAVVLSTTYSSAVAGVVGSVGISLGILALSSVNWEKAGKGFNKYIF